MVKAWQTNGRHMHAEIDTLANTHTLLHTLLHTHTCQVITNGKLVCKQSAKKPAKQQKENCPKMKPNLPNTHTHTHSRLLIRFSPPFSCFFSQLPFPPFPLPPFDTFLRIQECSGQVYVGYMNSYSRYIIRAKDRLTAQIIT